jgi:hypothetical protein
MKAQKRMVPEWGAELDGVWFPAELLEELAEQGPYTSQFGQAFSVRTDQERVLLARGLAEKETRGGLHAGPAMKQFWAEFEFAGVPDELRGTAFDRASCLEVPGETGMDARRRGSAAECAQELAEALRRGNRPAARQLYRDLAGNLARLWRKG